MQRYALRDDQWTMSTGTEFSANVGIENSLAGGGRDGSVIIRFLDRCPSFRVGDPGALPAPVGCRAFWLGHFRARDRHAGAGDSWRLRSG